MVIVYNKSIIKIISFRVIYMDDFQRIINEVRKVVNGKDEVIANVMLAILTNGNILIEDIPGVGKTTMALAFSKAMGLDYGRVQFTPDTLPTDITGYVVYNKETGKMAFNNGAIFCNLFLADELNRTSSRTQSALLEAMEEQQVTVEGRSYPLNKPFSVIATQNPVGASGTQLLPDSQTDRFTVRLTMGYPDFDEECQMVLNRAKGNPLDKVKQVVTAEQLIKMQQAVQDVFVHEDIVEYIVSLIKATRNSKYILRGASPRATLSLTDMAKAVAFASGRDYVVPKDVRSIFVSTLNHRIILSSEAVSKKLTAQQILLEILKSVKQPKV